MDNLMLALVIISLTISAHSLYALYKPTVVRRIEYDNYDIEWSTTKNYNKVVVWGKDVVAKFEDSGVQPDTMYYKVQEYIIYPDSKQGVYQLLANLDETYKDKEY